MQITKILSNFLSKYVRNLWNLRNFKVVLQLSDLRKSVITKVQFIVSKQDIVHSCNT